MKQTKDILKQLESSYSNIEYYNLIINEIEQNVNINPDIAIESCKSLCEGMSKFIWKQIDFGYNSAVADSLNYQDLFKKSLAQLASKCDIFEEDFIKRTGSIIHLLGEIRSKRGDISHGKLSPKEHYSDIAFSNLVMNVTDGIIYYLLSCFITIPKVKKLEYEDFPDFNEKLDNENPLGFLSYSRALFDQEPVTYQEELQNYLDSKETSEIDV